MPVALHLAAAFATAQGTRVDDAFAQLFAATLMTLARPVAISLSADHQHLISRKARTARRVAAEAGTCHQLTLIVASGFSMHAARYCSTTFTKAS